MNVGRYSHVDLENARYLGIPSGEEDASTQLSGVEEKRNPKIRAKALIKSLESSTLSPMERITLLFKLAKTYLQLSSLKHIRYRRDEMREILNAGGIILDNWRDQIPRDQLEALTSQLYYWENEHFTRLRGRWEVEYEPKDLRDAPERLGATVTINKLQAAANLSLGMRFDRDAVLSGLITRFPRNPLMACHPLSTLDDESHMPPRDTLPVDKYRDPMDSRPINHALFDVPGLLAIEEALAVRRGDPKKTRLYSLEVDLVQTYLQMGRIADASRLANGVYPSHLSTVDYPALFVRWVRIFFDSGLNNQGIRLVKQLEKHLNSLDFTNALVAAIPNAESRLRAYVFFSFVRNNQENAYVSRALTLAAAIPGQTTDIIFEWTKTLLKQFFHDPESSDRTRSSLTHICEKGIRFLPTQVPSAKRWLFETWLAFENPPADFHRDNQLRLGQNYIGELGSEILGILSTLLRV